MFLAVKIIPLSLFFEGGQLTILPHVRFPGVAATALPEHVITTLESMSAQHQIQRLEAIVQQMRAEVARLTQENGQLRVDKTRLKEENSRCLMALQAAADQSTRLKEENGRLIMALDLAAAKSTRLKEENGRLLMALDVATAPSRRAR